MELGSAETVNGGADSVRVAEGYRFRRENTALNVGVALITVM